MKEDTSGLPQTPVEQSVGAMSEAEIDANVKDTFPASDPPARTLGSDHREVANEDHNDDKS